MIHRLATHPVMALPLSALPSYAGCPRHAYLWVPLQAYDGLAVHAQLIQTAGSLANLAPVPHLEESGGGGGPQGILLSTHHVVMAWQSYAAMTHAQWPVMPHHEAR